MYLSRERLIALALVIILIVVAAVLFVSQTPFSLMLQFFTLFALVGLAIFTNERARLRGTPTSRRFLALRVLSILLKTYAALILLHNLFNLFPAIEPNYGGFGEFFFNMTHLFELTNIPVSFWGFFSILTGVVCFSLGQMIDWGLALEENTRHTATILGERFRGRQNNSQQ